MPLRDPTTIITWNANGLIPRIKGDLDALRAMVRDRDPDVVCLQEARVKAYTSNPKAKVSSSDRRMRGRPLGDEWRGALEKALTSPPLAAYHAFWSLANGRAAGTLMLVHKRVGKPKVVNALAAARAGWGAGAAGAAGTAGAAGGSNSAGSGGGNGGGGSSSSRSSSTSSSSKISGGGGVNLKEHHPEGRIQYASFATLDVLNTYSPNRGWSQERIAIRRQWDEDMIAFLAARKQAMEGPGEGMGGTAVASPIPTASVATAATAASSASSSSSAASSSSSSSTSAPPRSSSEKRGFVWTGDLNVAHTKDDSTDDEFFRGEWDRDGRRFKSKEEYDAGKCNS